MATRFRADHADGDRPYRAARWLARFPGECPARRGVAALPVQSYAGNRSAEKRSSAGAARGLKTLTLRGYSCRDASAQRPAFLAGSAGCDVFLSEAAEITQSGQ